jgi:hypothetical protein
MLFTWYNGLLRAVGLADEPREHGAQPLAVARARQVLEQRRAPVVRQGAVGLDECARRRVLRGDRCGLVLRAAVQLSRSVTCLECCRLTVINCLAKRSVRVKSRDLLLQSLNCSKVKCSVVRP